MPWEGTWQTTERKRYQKTRSGDWDKVYDQAFEASDERFSNAFSYEDIRHCEEFIVHECWGLGFPIEPGDKQELEKGNCALAICHPGKDMTEHVAGKWEKVAIKTEDGTGCNTMGTLALIGITVLERVGILKVFGGPSHPNTLKPKLMKKGEKMGLMEITQDEWEITRDLWLELEHEVYNAAPWTCENIMGHLKSLDRSVDTEERDAEIALKQA